MHRLLLSLFLALSLAATALGETHEHRIPLDRGIVDLRDLNAAFCDELHLPNCPDRGKVDLNGPLGADFLTAVNACLWDGCSLNRGDGTTVILKVEPIHVSSKIEAIRRLSRIYVAEKEPAATAAQARNWGLLLPVGIDSSRPLIVLIHGLDADRSDCTPIGNLLQGAGQQVAYFSYPGNQPIVDSAASLRRALDSLRARHPGLLIDIVAHSMGGLVARQYVECPEYAGGVRRLILVAPPNHGSAWARLQTILSIEENLQLRHDNPDWRWSWLVTEGLGEAGSDLLPDSQFLQQLNSRPRRTSVRYTIIAGNRSGVNRAEAIGLSRVASWIPRHSRHWWGVRNCYCRLEQAAGRLRSKPASGDGPVALASTRLSGVSDYVVLPADHVSLYLPVDGQPPAAWPAIRSRIVADR